MYTECPEQDFLGQFQTTDHQARDHLDAL